MHTLRLMMPYISPLTKTLCQSFLLGTIGITQVDHAYCQVLQRRVHIWFSAFIPKVDAELPDYIFPTSNGKYVLEAPFAFGYLGGSCFTSDNRLFDSLPTASARINVDLVLTISGKDMSVAPGPTGKFARIDLTHNVNCKTGEDLRPPRRAPEDRISVGPIVKGNFIRSLYIDAAGANPFYPSTQIPGTGLAGTTPRYLGLSPDIDFKISLRYEVLMERLVLTGTVGYFPSFEAYYSIDDGPTKIVYQLTPFEKSTALNLVDFSTGINTRNVNDIILLR